MRSWRREGALALALMLAACADIAGIEAGHLRTEDTPAGSSGQASIPSAGSSAVSAGGSTLVTAGSSGSGTSAGGSSSGGEAGGSGGEISIGSGGSVTSGGAAGSSATCPSDMILASSSQGYPFCIDAFEVTNAQYLDFINHYSAGSTMQTAVCANNASFVPADNCPSALHDVPSRQVPVVCVDWCDARAYCTSRSKRLCGRIGGTENPPSDGADAAKSEWYAACVGSDARTTSGNACNDSSFTSGNAHALAASDIPDCEGGVSGLFDMSGNVAEWENACDSSDPGASCTFRGGSYQDGPFELQCGAMISSARDAQLRTVGIRCCADPG